MKLRGLLLVILLGTMVPLTPMAYASPPDPVWVSGVFDAADYDDVVLLITSSGAAVDPFPLDSVQPLPIPVATIALAAETTAAYPAVSLAGARAPPAS